MRYTLRTPTRNAYPSCFTAELTFAVPTCLSSPWPLPKRRNDVTTRVCIPVGGVDRSLYIPFILRVLKGAIHSTSESRNYRAGYGARIYWQYMSPGSVSLLAKEPARMPVR